jgi:proteic killer suppression protein
VIRSFANSATRRFYEDGKAKQFRGLDARAAQEALASLNSATALRDISPLKSVGLHPLKGSRKGQWAISINGPWRICFRFADGDAHDVEVVDYHRG